MIDTFQKVYVQAQNLLGFQKLLPKYSEHDSGMKYDVTINNMDIGSSLLLPSYEIVYFSTSRL